MDDLTKSQQTHFVELNEDELTSKLLLASKKKSDICIWNKGEPKKNLYPIKEFTVRGKKLVVGGDDHMDDFSSDVLFTFDIDGLAFFGKGKLKRESNDSFAINAISKIYKSERRRNFRLLTFPVYEVFLEFYETEEPQEVEGGNVVDFKTGVSQTGLFRDFLKLMAVNEGGNDNGGIRLRVQDISVTGASFLVGEVESKYFKAGETTGRLIVFFQDEEVEIKNSKIVYVMKAEGRNKKIKTYKVGMQFTEYDQKADLQLGKLINKALRDVKDEFEDFIS
jgi:hypothetical protein